MNGGPTVGLHWGYLGSQQHMMQMLCWAPDIDIYKYLCLSTLYCIAQTFDIVTYDYQCFFSQPPKKYRKVTSYCL